MEPRRCKVVNQEHTTGTRVSFSEFHRLVWRVLLIKVNYTVSKIIQFVSCKMPFEIVDPRTVYMPDFFHDPCFSVEKQTERMKPNIMPDYYQGIDGMFPGYGTKSVSSTPLEKLLPFGAHSVDYLNVQHSLVPTNQREKAQWRKYQTANIPNSWRLMDQTPCTRSSNNAQPSSFWVDRSGTGVGRIQHESSLFSCSLSETYDHKSRLPSNDALFIRHGNTTVSNYEKDRPIESLRSFEAQTIANILPDEDDLFSGLNDEAAFTKNHTAGETLDDFDIFASGGGMELDRDNIDVAFQEPHSAIGANKYIENINSQGYIAPNTYHSQVQVPCARNSDAINGSYHSLNQMNYDFGSFGKKSFPSHAFTYEGNKSSPCQYNPSSPMKSQHPFLNNGFQARCQPPLHMYPKASDNMKNASMPMQHFHGSSLPVNRSTWERSINYTHGAPVSEFHLGSLGSPRIPCNSPLNTLENISPNVFTHVGGGFIELFANAGLYSPQHTSHIFPGRNPVMSAPTSVDSQNGSMRFRRKDVKFDHADKKQFELDIGRILRGEDGRTTLMIKNIPNKYTSRMLLASIDEHHQGSYDFIYLPIDFKNKCNVGYAFVNMIDPLQIVPFHKTFNGKKWEKFNSEKVALLAYARIQGKAALVTHFQHSSLMNEDKRCRPILLYTNGPNAGDQEPFPMCSNIRSRFGRGSSSTNDNRDEPSNETDSSSSSTME